MRTDRLIDALAADKVATGGGSRRRLALLMAAGFVCSAAAFWLALAPRPDFWVVAREWRFVLKFVVTLTLAAAALALIVRLARPAARVHAASLLLAPALLLIACLVDLASSDPAQWTARLVGVNARVCLTAIPLLSIPLLAAALSWLHGGAPTRPALTGAVAGLAAGGLAATLYASHCTDDSPLFVALWYGLAIALVTLVGAGLGGRVLRW